MAVIIPPKCTMLFLLIDVIDTHECTGEGGYFAEGYEQGFMYLALRVDKDTAEEHYQASNG